MKRFIAALLGGLAILLSPVIQATQTWTEGSQYELLTPPLSGVSPDVFLSTARSFGVDVRMRAADAQVPAMHAPGTPCIVVNGKYRINMDTLHSQADLRGLLRYLGDKESPHL
jgi:hypothetical protein